MSWRTPTDNEIEPTGLALALNDAGRSGDGDTAVALNVELPDDGSVPEWVQLVPAGPTIEGADGRSWQFSEAEAARVVEAFNARNRELPIDWEHASEKRAPQGEEAPAAGWLRELAVQEGSLYGRVAWTERAAGQIRRREYRYLSPVFLFTPQDRRVVRLTSAGLTNQPNFALRALNREATDDDAEEDAPVKWKQLMQKLGLSEDASEDDALEAVDGLLNKLQSAQNSEAQPSLDKFVPRGDYDAAVTRATNAEQKLAEKERSEHEQAIEAAVNQALEAGQITPATAEYHKAQCRTEGGLERFKEFIKTAPAVTAPSGLDGQAPPDGGDKALNAEMRQMASIFGNSEDDLKQYGGLGNGAE